MDDLDRLRIAYSFDVLLKVSMADGAIDERELAVVQSAWPAGTLEGYGFVDGTGPTQVFRDAASAARQQLPLRLTHAQKLLLLGFFHTACMADGELHPAEVKAVHESADELGVSMDQLSAHLDQLTGVDSDAPPRRRL